MKDLSQQIIIDKPLEKVFAFCIDPNNTAKWVDSIVTEETNEWPVRIGTIYRNQDHKGVWTKYELTVFEPDITFTLKGASDDYLRYSFTRLRTESTKLIYEWHGEELEKAALELILYKLKTVIEALPDAKNQS